MNNQTLIVIGFGNSQGQLSKTIIEEKYQNIQRFGMKLQVSYPRVRRKQQNAIDVDLFKTMISQRRNQALLNSFLKISKDEEISVLQEVKDEAKRQIKNINQQMSTMEVVKKEVRINKFVNQTKATQQIAREYFHQFNSNVQKSIQKYKQRMMIVKKFADKNKISQKQAMNILKDNGYNASLFD